DDWSPRFVDLVDDLEASPTELNVRHSFCAHFYLVINIGKSEANLSRQKKQQNWYSCSRLHNHPSSLDRKSTLQHHPDCLAVCDVFLFQDASSQRVLVVAVEHRHHFLHQDGTVIEVRVHEVHRAARDLHTVVEGLLLGLQPGERRQQR